MCVATVGIISNNDIIYGHLVPQCVCGVWFTGGDTLLVIQELPEIRVIVI